MVTFVSMKFYIDSEVKPRGLASASRPKNLASTLASWVLASALWALASASWVLASASWSTASSLEASRGQEASSLSIKCKVEKSYDWYIRN